MKKEHEIIVVDDQEHAPGQSLALISPKELKAQINAETEKRKLITDFIKHHMKEGTDYGRIHVMPKDKCDKGNRCENEYHYSKPTLFKAGSEKFCSLMKLRVEYTKDTDTWEMLGSESGMICYVARLYTPNNQLVGEGRGVASVKEKSNANTAVKIAQKRAKLDATLSTGGLSDFFTQDLEEEEYQAQLRGEKPGKKKAAPQKLSANEAFEKAMKQISVSKNSGALVEVSKNIESSKLYSDEQKKQLLQAISNRVDTLDNVIDANA